MSARNLAWLSFSFSLLFLTHASLADDVRDRLDWWTKNAPQYVPRSQPPPQNYPRPAPVPYPAPYNAPAVNRDSGSVILTISRLSSQEQSNWCWAAVTQGIARHLRSGDFPQCEMASRFIAGQSSNYCCQSAHASNVECNKGFNTGTALNGYSVLGQSYSYALDQTTLRRELQSGRPMALTVQLGPTHWHALLVYGINSNGSLGETILYGWDPGAYSGRFVKSRAELQAPGWNWVETMTSRSN